MELGSADSIRNAYSTPLELLMRDEEVKRVLANTKKEVDYTPKGKKVVYAVVMKKDKNIVLDLGGGAQIQVVRNRGIVSLKCVAKSGKVMHEYKAKVS